MLWEGGDISPRRRCGIDANQYTLFKRGMFAHGPTRTSRGVRAYVARWVKADVAEGQEHQAASLVRRQNGSRLHLWDRDGQKLAYVYFEEEPGRQSAAKLLTRDEARRIAVNFAKLSELQRKA
jgi:hypothetical protein